MFVLALFGCLPAIYLSLPCKRRGAQLGQGVDWICVMVRLGCCWDDSDVGDLRGSVAGACRYIRRPAVLVLVGLVWQRRLRQT